MINWSLKMKLSFINFGYKTSFICCQILNQMQKIRTEKIYNLFIIIIIFADVLDLFMKGRTMLSYYRNLMQICYFSWHTILLQLLDKLCESDYKEGNQAYHLAPWTYRYRSTKIHVIKCSQLNIHLRNEQSVLFVIYRV